MDGRDESKIVRLLHQSYYPSSFLGCRSTLHHQHDGHDAEIVVEHEEKDRGDVDDHADSANKIQMLELVYKTTPPEEEPAASRRSYGQRQWSLSSTSMYCPPRIFLHLAAERFQVVWSLSKLEVLTLHQYPHVVFARGMEQLQHLKQFTIQGAPNLTSLPDNLLAGLLQNLESVSIQDCPKLISLPLTTEKLQRSTCNLRCLEIHDCGSLTALSLSIGGLVAEEQATVEELKITRCERIQQFPAPEIVVILENVKKLTLDYTTCPAFSRIPKECFQRHQMMRKLERFEVQRWRHVESNFPFFDILSCYFAEESSLLLQDLDLSDCDQFHKILKFAIPKLQNLKRLSIRYHFPCQLQHPSISDRLLNCRQSWLDPEQEERDHGDAAILALKRLPHLEHLCLEGIAPEDIQRLFRHDDDNKEQQPWNGGNRLVLRELDLTRCGLRDDYVEILKGLPHSLTHLNLRHNMIDDDLNGMLVPVNNNDNNNKKLLPRGLRSFLLDGNPVFQKLNSESSEPVRILKRVLGDNPRLGSICDDDTTAFEDMENVADWSLSSSSSSMMMITPSLRAQLWSNRCGLFLLSRQQQQQQPVEAEGEKCGTGLHEKEQRPHLPIAAWALILARVNVIFDTALKLEKARPWCFAQKRNICNLKVQRVDTLHRFVQNYPLWTTI